MQVRLLIVDDEIEICEMLKRHFEFLNYEVVTAHNGLEAVELLSHETISIVISDIVMPKMNGVELLTHIRQHFPMIRVIMITGYVSLHNALTCMRKQADTIIFKPIEDIQELEQAVADAVRMMQKWEEKLKTLQNLNPSKAATHDNEC
ncbi:MAG: response regulator [Chitinivibrionales bacterium]|nr:response regulator [Chitinivibrionales bacterium]